MTDNELILRSRLEETERRLMEAEARVKELEDALRKTDNLRALYEDTVASLRAQAGKEAQP